MANIQSFDTGALSLRPTEEGVNTVAGNARRIGAFYNQSAGALEGLAASEKNAFNSAGHAIGSGIQAAGDAYVNYEDHKQISHGAAVGTEAVAKLDGSLNDAVKKADPNDSSFASKFMETEFEPWADKFREQFTTEKGQQFAEQFIDRYRQHFTTKAAADISTQAGIAAKENAGKTINNLSSMVYNDPSSLDTAIDTMKHSATHIVGSSPTIDAETGARVTSELNQKGIESLVKSAVTGMIAKNPNIDLDAIQKKYGDYINGGELKMFQKQAQVQSRADLLQSKQIETYQRQQQERAANDAFTKSRTDNIAADDNGNLTINPKIIKDALDITRKYPEAGTSALDTTIKFVEAQQNHGLKAADDPAVVKGLSDGLFDPNKPTTAIDLMRARAKGQISDHTFSVMHGIVKELEETPLKGPIYQDTMKAAHSALVLTGVGIPGKDDKGEQNYALFVQHFIPQYLAASRAGTLPPNALDVNDPKSMISQAMAPFKRTVTQRISDYTASLGGVGPSGDPAPAIPEPEKREKDKVYETPRGPMKWTGTGWVPKFGEGSFGMSDDGRYVPGGASHYSDFRRSDNIEDRRDESQVLVKLKEMLVGGHAMSPREIRKWALDQPVDFRNKMAKALGLLDVGDK